MGLRSNKRMRLIVAANRLLHRKGYDRSSIADIANEAAVPPGNVYYYFKTKDEIVEAVIERRNAYITACLADLAAIKRPAQRLVQFVDEFEKTSQPRAKFGCPIGGLCQEANRIGGAIAEQSGAVFRILLDWLRDQFAALGQNPEFAATNALHVLASLQGATLLAATFRDLQLIESETAWLKDWLGGMPAGGALGRTYDQHSH